MVVRQQEVLGRAFLIYLDGKLWNVLGSLTRPEVAQFQEREVAAAALSYSMATKRKGRS
jgi:hypothetical protein